MKAKYAICLMLAVLAVTDGLVEPDSDGSVLEAIQENITKIATNANDDAASTNPQVPASIVVIDTIPEGLDSEESYGAEEEVAADNSNEMTDVSAISGEDEVLGD